MELLAFEGLGYELISNSETKERKDPLSVFSGDNNGWESINRLACKL